MIRKLVGSLVVMVVCIGLVTAEEFSANVSKVDGGKITFFKTKKGKKDGDEMVLPAAKDVKVNKGTISFADKKVSVEVGDAIEGGLKSETFTKIDEKKGLNVRITTSEDNKTITNVVVTTFKKK